MIIPVFAALLASCASKPACSSSANQQPPECTVQAIECVGCIYKGYGDRCPPGC